MIHPPLLVFADDWGRHPSSSQHLIRQLLPRREVWWVNTIGTRPPRFDWGTFKRATGKLKSWFVKQAPTQASVSPVSPALSPKILSPKMWPAFKPAFARQLNRHLLLKALRPVIEAMPAPPVAITTLPLVADLIGELPVAKWVYYCVDDFSVWPGYDGSTMLRMEREMAPKIDTAIAVSETLQNHLAQLGHKAYLLTHGVDLDHWTAPTGSDGPPTEFAGLEPPFVLFWGVIDRRMDLAFVRAVSSSLKVGTLVLIGPQEDPDPELLRLPRVAVRPAVAFARLPALAAAASVLVMPYRDAPVTRAMQPLKFKEYLATGKPTVVRALPTTAPWADSADIAETPEAFAHAVTLRLHEGNPLGHQQARVRLRNESWAGKAELFEGWVNCAERTTHQPKVS